MSKVKGTKLKMEVDKDGNKRLIAPKGKFEEIIEAFDAMEMQDALEERRRNRSCCDCCDDDSI